MIKIEFKNFEVDINHNVFLVSLRIWPPKNTWLSFHPREFSWFKSEVHYFNGEPDWIAHKFLWFSVNDSI